MIDKNFPFHGPFESSLLVLVRFVSFSCLRLIFSSSRRLVVRVRFASSATRAESETTLFFSLSLSTQPLKCSAVAERASERTSLLSVCACSVSASARGAIFRRRRKRKLFSTNRRRILGARPLLRPRHSSTARKRDFRRQCRRATRTNRLATKNIREARQFMHQKYTHFRTRNPRTRWRRKVATWWRRRRFSSTRRLRAVCAINRFSDFVANSKRRRLTH